jgi:hypothetical protein
MASDAVDQPARRPLLTLGRVDLVRVQVGYRARPDGPVHQQFLLDLPVPDAERAGVAHRVDEARVLGALEPVLYPGSGAPRHYSLHAHRWHTSWGPGPGALEIGLLVTAGSRTEAVSESWVDGVTRAFRDLMDAAGRPESPPTSREAALARARSSVATTYALDPDGLSPSAEEHHAGDNSWTVALRASAGERYDVVVGLVDGFAGSVRVRHRSGVEVSDSVGSE